jgi:ABC-2 type transport system permease protein
MTLWRLELARTVRTHRWMLVVGVYAFFGAAGPLLARYLEDIVANFGGGEVAIVGAAPRPVDGIGQFVGNTSQLGVLAVIVVAASALALDARVEFSAFLRTKVARAGTLVVPRFAVAAATALLGLWVGTAIAWAVTAGVLGALPAGPMLVGTLLGSLYLTFAVAVVAAVASVVRSVPGTVFASLAVLLVLPIAAIVAPAAPWLPSELLAAVAGLIEGAPAADYLGSSVVALGAVAALVAFSAWRVERREP